MSGQDGAKVIVYTGDFCGYCRAAKRLLDTRSVAYEEINVSKIAGARQELMDRTGWRTIPVIEVDGELVGGYTELVASDRGGGLSHLMNDAD